jgi:hypothetical protein
MHVFVSIAFFPSKRQTQRTTQIKTLMNTTQKTLNAFIYTLGVLLAGSLGALLMFLVIDV